MIEVTIRFRCDADKPMDLRIVVARFLMMCQSKGFEVTLRVVSGFVVKAPSMRGFLGTLQNEGISDDMIESIKFDLE